MTIDLIYVIPSTGQKDATVSCVVLGDGHDKQLGPVPSKDAVSVLGPMLRAEVPEQFSDDQAATDYLANHHMSCMLARQNLAGQSYPWRTGA